jgi:hypothetical protein
METQTDAQGGPRRIALLGWGSLLWEGGHDFEKQHDDWKFDGPRLHLEFSRISETRLGALTLVIDREHGIPTTVAWCLSKRQNIDDAICDLRCREGTTVSNIGRLVVPESPPSADRNASPQEDINPMVAWAKSKKVDVVVWTALESNFNSKRKHPFSLAAAISHLKELPPAGKAKAAEYVWRAPNFVQTPLRKALQQEPWFSGPTD